MELMKIMMTQSHRDSYNNSHRDSYHKMGMRLLDWT